MTDMPNPFEFAASDAAAEQAAASIPSPQSPGAAADPFHAGGPQESPAAVAMNPHETAGDLGIDCIGEIFAGARKMFDPDPAEYTSADQLLYDVLKAMDNPAARDLPHIPDEDAFMSEVEERPLFLRQAV
jgi:hypothetical protein